MAQPPIYTRQYNFNDFATTSPSTPLPGDKVDAELNAAKLTLDELNANIAKIQRDDGKLGNTAVHKDAFDAGALALMSTGSMTPRGSWSAGVSYVVSDLADFNNATYLATAAHTSASAFTTDLAASKWILLANAAISGTANSVDKFSGTGSQTAFTLTSSYASNTSVLIFVNGALRNPGDDYSISGATLTFVTAPPVPSVSGNENVIAWGPSVVAQAASDAALASSSNASGFANEAQGWASKVDGIVESTDYSSKAWSIGGSGVTDTASKGAAKEWATKTSGTVDGTNYSAKYWATGANVGIIAGAVSAINTVSGAITNVNNVGGSISNVNSVAGKTTEITALGTSANVSNMSTLAASGVVGNIASVAGISSNVTAVAGKASLITSDFVSDLNTVAVTDVINDINTLAHSDVVSDLNQLATSDFVSDLNQLATTTNVNNISTVAGIAANVTSVAGVASNVTTVAGISSAVSTVAADGSDIGTVAGISSAVSTVSSNNANVSAVAGAVSNVNTVAGAVSNVNTVAGAVSNVNTVAGISSAVSTVAADTTDIGNVSGSIANVNTVASNISGVNSFAAQYRIGSSDPTDSLDEGDLFYNTTANQLKIYTGSQWENAAPAGSGFLATSGGTMTGNLALGDNVKAVFGSGSDLAVFHDGLNSYISENSTGNLLIQGTHIYLKKGDGTENYIDCVANQGVTLRYDNIAKLATTSLGIDVNGTVKADQYNNDEALPDIRPSLLLDFANSKTLDPRITFTRGSTATFYDGVTTAKAEENLLKYSQELDNAAWSKSGTTITANNTAAPDGTTTADLILPSTSSSTKSIFQTGLTVSGDNTQSVYAKANGYTKVALRESDSGAYVASFNLAASGSVTANSNCTATITDVGNGWFRLTMTGNRTGATRWSTYILNPSSNNYGDSTAWSGDGTSGIYVWGAQLEQRSAVTAYTVTTSAPIVKYQAALQTAASGVARFDHAPLTGESKGLLIEEARTNIAYPSNQQSGTNLSRVTQNTTGAIAPDGTQTASIVRETTETGAHHIHDSIVGETANTVYTASVYLKNYGVSDVSLNMRISDSGDVYKKVFFDLDNSAVSFSGDAGYTGTITDVGNGWRRCTLTGDVGDGTNDLRVHVFACQGTGTVSSYTGNGWDGFGYWGLQVEAGSFATSYIPTTGAAATRPLENAEITDISFLNPTELTVYFESEQAPTDKWRRWFAFENNTYGVSEYSIWSDPTNYIYSYVRIHGVNQGISRDNAQIAEGVDVKAAMSIAEGKVAMSVNGATASVDSSVNLAGVNLTRLRIGRGDGNGNDRFVGKPIKKLAVYPKALSDATLKAMTTE